MNSSSLLPFLNRARTRSRNHRLSQSGCRKPVKGRKDTKFVDPVEAVKDSVKALQARKVNIIIVLSHLGLPFDEELARNVSGVDLIVGGHTHDYIGPGSPLGPYPIVEKSPSGKPALIVTTSGEAKFLGHLEVSFNKEGIPTSWNGEPVRLGKAGGSSEITKIINQAAEPVIKRNSTVVGTKPCQNERRPGSLPRR